MFSWSRTFYAIKNGQVYRFEAKRQRDTAVRYYGLEAITAKAAYDLGEPIKVSVRDFGKIDWSAI